MRTLVLNAGFEPLAVVPDRRAIVLILSGKASVLESDPAHPVRAVHDDWPRPTVVLLTRYVHVPLARLTPVSRRGVLRRDANTCAYCGGVANTIDHVLPKSRGGRDSWENLVACCLRCNNRKGDHTPEEMGWTLRWQPKPPNSRVWTVRGAEHELPEWSRYLGGRAA